MSSDSYSSAPFIFRLFKYSVYAVLIFNVYLFFQEEWLATEQTFSQGIVFGDLISGFAATIDTAAWVLLLLLFELETSAIPDPVLRLPKVKYSFMAVRTFSYGFILYAFYGYFDKMLLTYNISPFVVDDLCALIGQGYSTIVTIDEYPLLDQHSCAALIDQLASNQALFKLNGQMVLGTQTDWQAVQWLAWVDVINSIHLDCCGGDIWRWMCGCRSRAACTVEWLLASHRDQSTALRDFVCRRSLLGNVGRLPRLLGRLYVAGGLCLY